MNSVKFEFQYLQNAKVHVHITRRPRVYFPDGLGLLENLNRLMAGCNVTVLGLGNCKLGEGGARAMLEFLRRNTTAAHVARPCGQ